MRTAILLALALTWLTPQMVADRCNGEFSAAIEQCACTVVNRLAVGWSERRVLSAYYAPDQHATPAQMAQVSAVLDGSASCDPRLYFMYSRQDIAYLGYGDYTPALVVQDGGREVLFFERWFRKEQ